ncbi:MAG: hypothetical protein WCW52_08145 [Elusimicrobiales bacterium]|jgi:hypothetical protein
MMRKLKTYFDLAKRTITDPAGAAGEFMAPGAGSGGPLAVYLAYCAAYALFLYIKPADFPSEFSEAAGEFSGKPYIWLFAVQAFFELAFTAAFCALFAAFAGFLKEGRPAFKFLSGCAACGAYAAAAFYSRTEPKFAPPLLAAAGAAAYAGVRAARPAAAAFFRFSLAVNAAMLLCLPVYALAAALRSETLYTAAEAAGGLWLIVLTVKASKAVFGGTTARAALTLLFSMLTAVFSFYMLKNLDLIPAEIFRFMMFM